MRGPSHWTGNVSHDDGWAFPPPILFLFLTKRERAVDGPREKIASAGRAAYMRPSCRRRGMAGAPLQKSGTETPGPWGNLQSGAVRDTRSLPPRCRSRFFEEQPAAAKIDAGPCVNHPDALRTIRHGTAVTGVAEESSVPEGRPKSGQAPIRRPPCARRATAPECAQAAFSFGPCTARFLFRKTEKKMGGASRWTSPLREQNPPRPPSGGPSLSPPG